MQPTATMPQRYRTDAAVQKYLRKHTNMPLPTMTTCFEDDGAMCLAMEFLPGVQMDDLPEADRQVVAAELEQHLETLKALRSDTPGVPGEPLLIAPQRVTTYDWHYQSCWGLNVDTSTKMVSREGRITGSNHQPAYQRR